MQDYNQTVDLIHPGDLEPEMTKSDDDRYIAVVTGWIQEQDLQDLMERSLPARGPWRTALRAGILHQELPEDQLELFAQAAFRAALGLANWLTSHQQRRVNQGAAPQGRQDEIQQGRNNALDYAGHLVQQRAPNFRPNTRDWPEEPKDEWNRQALQRKTQAARTGDHHHFLRTLRDLRQESLNPGTPGRYAREIEDRKRQMDDFIRDCIGA